MKLISFNINGLRARPHQLEAILETHKPDVLGLQEIKVDDSQFPHDMLDSLGYYYHHHGQKGHYGVAVLTKHEPIEVYKGMPTDLPEAQKRMIGVKVPDGKGVTTVLNGYFPQGESRKHETKFPYKQKFYADLMAWLEISHSPQDNLAIMGDFNIAPYDVDIGIGENNQKRWLQTGKCSFLPEEREWMETLKAWGLTDTYRHLYPESTEFLSWFDYRSRGFDDNPKRGLRIDYILATAPLLARVQDSGMDYQARAMEKPSDHCPVWTSFSE